MRSVNPGTLNVITGPMFSGKSEELVKRLRRFDLGKLQIKVFNHAIDIRYQKGKIVSHNKDSWKAIPINKPIEILKKIKKNTRIVVVDEVQFFDNQIIEVINELVRKGITVFAAGLDTDYRGEPFAATASLLALADGEVVKLRSVCTVCKKWNATRTQRLRADGTPAAYNEPLIKVGAKDFYEARCTKHHIVPMKK